MKRSLLLCMLAGMCFTASFSQEKSPVKFGKVSADDFKSTVYSIDSNASAIVIADIGSTQFIGNNKGFFSLEFKHYKRMHVLNKNGYDIGDVTITLYTNGEQEEELTNLKAYTYNLDNGKVVETKLDTKSGVFKDKKSKNRVDRKFTFPNIKEGSIIEYEYTIKSDFLFNLQPWEFQGNHPRLWSEYKVAIPQFVSYVFLSQGYVVPHIKDKKDHNESFTVMQDGVARATERYTFTSGVTDHRWVMKDVAALKEEDFTSTLDNHIAKIEFQLSEYKEPLTYKNVMGTWAQLGKEMMEAEYFGGPLSKDNNWLGDVVDDLIKGVADPTEKARRIYYHVQNNFSCTRRGGLYLDQNLRNIVKNKRGTSPEINLLMVAMMRYAKITADPVILSTRSNGYSYAMYPLRDRFNHVVAQVKIGDKLYYLDASETGMGFGKMDYDCYNGHARVINEEVTPIELSADSLMEKKVSSIFLINGENGQLSGSMQQRPGYFESSRIRKRVKEKGQEQLFADIQKAFNASIEISEPAIDSLTQYDNEIALHYKFTLQTDKEDIIYFNPMFGEGYRTNPFKSAERFYPVEMPYTMDETYLLRLEIPAGYKIDELPKQMVVKLNEQDDGFFEYRISESNGAISLRSRIKILRTYFHPEEYEMLREFFNMIVKKQSEQIVFKKK